MNNFSVLISKIVKVKTITLLRTMTPSHVFNGIATLKYFLKTVSLKNLVDCKEPVNALTKVLFPR